MARDFEGSDEVLVHARPEQVWAILEDSRLLPRWAPMVKHTTGGTERLGSTRACEVEWEGRQDRVVERCVEAIPYAKIAWVMEEGMMTKMFSTIRFGFELHEKTPSATNLRVHFLYAPRHWLARGMYLFLMRRKLNQLRQTLLTNIKGLAELQASEQK